jgi:hypothetical protein
MPEHIERNGGGWTVPGPFPYYAATLRSPTCERSAPTLDVRADIRKRRSPPFRA